MKSKKPPMKCRICKKKLSPIKGHVMVRNKDGFLIGYECWECVDKILEKLKREHAKKEKGK